MKDNPSTRDFLKALQAGDPTVEEQVYNKYAPRLLHVAQQHLSKKLASRLDPEDVVQSVFRTFFRRQAEGTFQIDNSAQLWKLLVKITVRKTCAKARHHTADKREVGKEVPIDGGADGFQHSEEGPGPEDVAVLLDLIEAMFEGLQEVYARVLEMRLGGYSAAEIADELGVARQTVYRALDRLQTKLLGFLETEE